MPSLIISEEILITTLHKLKIIDFCMILDKCTVEMGILVFFCLSIYPIATND